MKKIFSLFVLILAVATLNAQPRYEQTLCEGWEFRRADTTTTKWENVTIPHDWAIYGPFDRNNDLYSVAVIQNGETEAEIKTGRTGGLPYIGKGEYRLALPIEYNSECCYTLLFDGAMAGAEVFVNGTKCGSWPYGYNSFTVDFTDVARSENLIEVRLENLAESSRWYPGAGLYRNVHLIRTNRIHVPVWGTQLATPYVGADYASVSLKTKIEGVEDGATIRIATLIRNDKGQIVAERENTAQLWHGMPFEQHFTIAKPKLWSPETPVLYTAESQIYYNGQKVDTYSTRFGIRTIELRADKGFFLNGKMRKFKGVCLHHDLGPLGAAVNKAAIRHQLTMLKDMGCDAIRTSHNMPAPELVELCDEMGFMMMVEPFDEWDVAKCTNGYHRLWSDWYEKDMVNMLHHYRNNPSIVMWSVGNEVPTQWTNEGYKVARELQDICHREDPTRPVTCGMDQFDAVVNNGFAAIFDLPGFNYKVHRYGEAYDKLPQNLILGSETASTVSTRGVYYLPHSDEGKHIMHSDLHSCSYDTEYCYWSNIPDYDFAADEDLPYIVGQFVWTGFDYLGEPTPYDNDSWPCHSSNFGIIDLASIPKDRFYLYRSVWNTESPTLHILPHWNWSEYENKTIPVFVYTSYPSAELFLNGKSQGRRTKQKSDDVKTRYRLMWNDVKYTPGELKVVAYDAEGNPVAEQVMRTAGKAVRLEAVCNRTTLDNSGTDLAYIEVRAVDKEGNLAPLDMREVRFNVEGKGTFRAVANGDPKCLESFQRPVMHLFNGRLMAIIQAKPESGEIRFEATAKGLKPALLSLEVK